VVPEGYKVATVCKCKDTLCINLGRRKQVLQDGGHPGAQLGGEVVQDDVRGGLREGADLPLGAQVVAEDLEMEEKKREKDEREARGLGHE
jgi:hypothetical protein